MKITADTNVRVRALMQDDPDQARAAAELLEQAELVAVPVPGNPERYPGQRILVVRLDDYAHLVPFVETADRSASEDHHSQPQGNPSLPFGIVIMQATPRLEPEEQQLLNDFEAGALHSVGTPELLTQLRASARTTGQKDQRINIRLSSPDLQALRARTLQEGIPYQTLISSVLHKYISGALREEPAPR